MKTNRKLNGPMLIAAAVIALGVFLLLALVAFKRDHYESPQDYELPGLFFGISALQWNSLGGAAYFLVTIALAWAVIVFFRERDGEILVRGAGTAVLICAAATLFALWGNDYLGGNLGAGISSVVQTFPGVVIGSILMSVVFVVSFIVATDWLFYSALREAISGPDLMRSDQTPAPLPSVFETTEAEVNVEVAEPAAEEEEGTVAAGPIETQADTTEFAEDESAEAAADRVVVTEDRPGAAATEAAVPTALRDALGANRGTIEVEPSDVEFASEDEAPEPWESPDPWTAVPTFAVEESPAVEIIEDEREILGEEDPSEHAMGKDEAPVVEEAAPADEEPADEEPEVTRVDVGHRGHRIAVEPNDVEFAEDEDAEETRFDLALPPAVIEEEEIVVDEEAMSRLGPRTPFPTPPATPRTQVEPELDTPAATPEVQVEPEPDAPPSAEAAAEAHLGMVLEDEIIEWGAPPIVDEEDETPGPEAVAEEDVEVAQDPPAETGPGDLATARMTSVLDSLLGPIQGAEPEVQVAVLEEEEPESTVAADVETEIQIAVTEEDREPPEATTPIEPEATTEEEEDKEVAEQEVEPVAEEPPPVDRDVDETPEPTVDVDVEDEDQAAPEEPPRASFKPEAAEKAAADREDASPPPRSGLLGWFRRRRVEEEVAEAPAAMAKTRSRRHDPETPSLFDEEPPAGSLAPDTELVDRAARLAIDSGRASIVLFQRKLAIGYHRARALVERLLEEGVLGPMGETGSHPVLLSEEAWSEKGSPVA